MSRFIYLDNNATTLMPAKVLKTMLAWTNKGNPSADYESAKECRRMMDDFRRYIAKTCGFSIDHESRNSSVQDDIFRVIFTSCGSESNGTILRSIVDAYTQRRKICPHIILSAVEHKSLLDCALQMHSRGQIELTLIPPNSGGQIPPDEVQRAFKSNTALVSIMHANNETGAINDIREIGKRAHAANIPFHTDAVQTFGKYPVNPLRDNVDAFSVSFHKYQGPPGIGALIIRQRLMQGWDLQPLIFGSQNEGFRGGTENIPGIAAAFAGLKLTLESRATKNKKLLEMKKYIMKELSARLPCKAYTKYLEEGKVILNNSMAFLGRQNGDLKRPKELEIVFLSGCDGYLPNTLLFSVVKRSQPPICNSKIKKALEAKGIIISIGSACNTASPKASHVLYAMEADELVRKGALRVSLGDLNTLDECKRFVREFISILANDLSA